VKLTTDLRGAARLAAEGAIGLTSLVEAMHQRIASPPGVKAAASGRTSGITGLVYRSVRGVTRAVGGVADGTLALLQQLLPASADAVDSPGRDAAIAAINGVLGDHLADTGNPLAITMALRVDGQALPLERAALAARLPQAGPKLVVLMHGLCMNDRLWQRQDHDHGRMLARELGFTPVYLHYNSGRAIADNGREFAGLMQRLLDSWPVALEQVVLLTHSMGGLVARCALQQAAEAGLAWPQQIDELVFLGTPHHGAPLERAGHGLDLLLAAAPYAAPLARLGRVRSAGITDLRHGLRGPLPQGPRCWAVAATLSRGSGRLKDHVLGDGLVPLNSALGRHTDRQRTLRIPRARQCVLRETGHLELLNSPAVAAQLLQWLKP
jgi:pimeloyl-ACP methyl ester carboxylesterase